MRAGPAVEIGADEAVPVEDGQQGDVGEDARGAEGEAEPAEGVHRGVLLRIDVVGVAIT